MDDYKSLPADLDDAPEVITVAGRNKDRENQDLQGEYHRIKVLYHGRPAYRKPGTQIVIRYWSVADRWLIDRDGLQESDICNAYAEQGGAKYPASEDLVWRVWETQHRQHLRDPELLVTAAPSVVQVIGRACGKENWALNGEYRLVGLHQGRPAYQKTGKFKHAIRYWEPGDRWLIDLEGLREVDVCNAYADAGGSLHPGNANLTWHVWDSQRSVHIRDPGLRALVTPAVVELVGREAPRENASMNGSYHIFQMHAGRPAYLKADGSGHAIRYWPREDRWLVDLDGLQDKDVCNAYAEASGSFEHPGNLNIMWHVWETSRGRHLTDVSVRTFVAPHWVCISGRLSSKENATINGTYELAKIVEGKVAYKKEGHDHVIRYWPTEDRWIIDLEAGFHGGDIANAYADAKGAEHPGNSDLVWYVWETSQGCHVTDEDVVAEAAWLPVPNWSTVFKNSLPIEEEGAPSATQHQAVAFPSRGRAGGEAVVNEVVGEARSRGGG